jgi:hypothetical protein
MTYSRNSSSREFKLFGSGRIQFKNSKLLKRHKKFVRHRIHSKEIEEIQSHNRDGFQVPVDLRRIHQVPV